MQDIFRWQLPLDISEHGHRIDAMIEFVHWFMVVLFIGWGIYFIYCLIRFRARAGHQPSTVFPKAKVTKWVEIGVVVIEVVLLIGFSFPIWADVRDVSNAPDPADATVVRVVAEQFAWNVHYPGEDGKFGRTDIHMMSGENPLGLDRSDANAKDDIFTVNQLHVPVKKPVLVYLTSKDVIHSFGLPMLRIKQDAIPGMRVPVWFTPTRTTADVQTDPGVTRSYSTGEANVPRLAASVAMEDAKNEDGDVIVTKGADLNEEALAKLREAGITQVTAAPRVPTEIACAQLCGLGHYRMRGEILIETETDFKAWMQTEIQLLEEEGDDEEW
jgi:cytochrome c oxidase subunit 2